MVCLRQREIVYYCVTLRDGEGYYRASEWDIKRQQAIGFYLFLLFRKQQVKSSNLFTGFPFRRSRSLICCVFLLGGGLLSGL